MKPKLLIISPQLPYYDKSSGNLRLYKILQILSKGHDITFIAQNESEYGEKEDERYLSVLQEMNIKTYCQNFSLPRVLLRNKYKAAFIEFYHTAEYYLPRIKLLQPRCPVVVDSVDVHYRRAKLKFMVTKKADDFTLANQVKERELGIYKKADMVITVTDEDANLLHEDSDGLRVFTIPNIHELHPGEEICTNHNMLFVGGFSHDPNVDAVIYLCEEIYPLVRKTFPDIQLTIVGSNPPERIRRFTSDSITVTGYVPSMDPFLRSHYISVAPLRYGAGMKGKIGEAMAYGLPVVTTSIGAQGMGLVHRFNSMVADNPMDFASSIVDIIRDKSLYHFVRSNALEHIKNRYSPEIVEKTINTMMVQLDSMDVMSMNLRNKYDFLYNYFKNKWN